jgi:hypothetical protein
MVFLDYVHPDDREAAQIRASLIAAQRQIEHIACRVEALAPRSETPGDDADQLFAALLTISTPLFDLAKLVRRQAFLM